MAMGLKGGFATDIGISREKNEDAILLQAIEQQGEWFAIGAVCDGIGGLERGDAAARLVIQEVKEWFERVSRWICIAEADAGALFFQLSQDAEQWNQRVCDFCVQNQIKSGTTMSLIMIIRNQYFILHVGDSRIYHYREFLTQLTQDEVTERITEGRKKTYLNNFMGKPGKLTYKTYTGELTAGDMFLYCSDGFYHKLTQDDMKYLVEQYRRYGSVYQICMEGIRMMEERLERDNISAGMIFLV